ASAPDDLEYIIHRGFVPIVWPVSARWCRGDERSSLVSYRLTLRYANGKPRMVFGFAARWRALFPKTACNPRSPRYTEVYPRCGRRTGTVTRELDASPDCVSRCGSSSGVEHHVANVGVEGSNPFSRS